MNLVRTAFASGPNEIHSRTPDNGKCPIQHSDNSICIYWITMACRKIACVGVRAWIKWIGRREQRLEKEKVKYKWWNMLGKLSKSVCSAQFGFAIDYYGVGRKISANITHMVLIGLGHLSLLAFSFFTSWPQPLDSISTKCEQKSVINSSEKFIGKLIFSSTPSSRFGRNIFKRLSRAINSCKWFQWFVIKFRWLFMTCQKFGISFNRSTSFLHSSIAMSFTWAKMTKMKFYHK